MMRMQYRYICLAGISMIIQFLLLQYLFPFPNFMQDSYNYLRSAATNIDANMWPVGYAKLIRFTGYITHSDTVLVLIQYFIYHLGALYFFFTILDVRPCSRWLRHAIFIFLFFNPAILFLSNYITSDVYFIAISLVWIAQLFRLIYQPGRLLLLSHLFVLLLAFSVRYHALVYPAISMTVMVYCRLPVRVKVLAILGTVVLVSGFVFYTTRQSELHLGKRQFSMFSGWQMASNALYAYAHMPVRPQEPVPARFAALHAHVNAWLDTVPLSQRPDKPLMAFFIWDPNSPLQPAPHAVNIADNAEHLRKMAAVAPLYNDYGKFLINRYPGAYLRYFIWPNFLQYAYPPTENFSVYNDGVDTVLPVAQSWFGYTTNKVYTRAPKAVFSFFKTYPPAIVLIMLCFMVGWVRYLLMNGRALANEHFRYALTIVTFYWMVNFAFSVLASPVVLRYQLFNMIIGFTFTGMLWDMKRKN